MIVILAAWGICGLVAFALFMAAEIMLELPHDHWWAYVLVFAVCLGAGPLIIPDALRSARSACREEYIPEEDD